MEYLFFLCLILFPAIWIISLFILSKWKHFYLFFGINLLIIGLYFYLITYTKIINSGHDEYGLGVIFYNLLFLMIHAFLGFIFALFYKSKFSQNVN